MYPVHVFTTGTVTLHRSDQVTNTHYAYMAPLPNSNISAVTINLYAKDKQFYQDEHYTLQ